MKIGIDISQVVYETGVSWYTLNLVKYLLQIDKVNDYVLFGGSLRRAKSLKLKAKNLSGNFRVKSYPIPPTIADLVWNRFHILPIELLLGKIDVFHSSDWSQPPAKAFKITTVHDLTPIIFPKETDPKIVVVHKRRLGWVKKEVDKIIVPSIATKKDLVKLDFDEAKIRVIAEAVDPTFDRVVKDEEVEKVKRKYGIVKKYILSIGIGERKNTRKIIEAFKKLRDGYQLVLVGEPKIEIPRIDNVIITGHIPSQDRPALYSGAEVFVYPSLYEGFGLPILEAFACSCPVVTSNISSMPEVAGDAAVLVNPDGVESIVEGIKTALNDRSDLIAKGFVRLKDFSWEKTAIETLDVYKGAL